MNTEIPASLRLSVRTPAARHRRISACLTATTAQQVGPSPRCPLLCARLTERRLPLRLQQRHRHAQKRSREIPVASALPSSTCSPESSGGPRGGSRRLVLLVLTPEEKRAEAEERHEPRPRKFRQSSASSS